MSEAQPPRVARPGEHKMCIPAKLLSLCPIAYMHRKGVPPLSLHSQHVTKHLICDYTKRNEAWWGTFIEM